MSSDDELEHDPGGEGVEEGASPPRGESAGFPLASPLTSPLAGLSDLLETARQQLEQASEEAANVEVVGRAGGGSVEIRMNGNLEAVAVRIAPEVVDPSDVAMLEDLVLAALRDALADVVFTRQGAASGLLPPGIDIGSMMQHLLPGSPGAVGAPGTPGSGADLFGSLGAALPGGLEGLNDFMNELFGPDGPIVDFGPEGDSDEDDYSDEDDDSDEDDGGEPA